MLDGVVTTRRSERIGRRGSTEHGSGFTSAPPAGGSCFPTEADNVSDALRIADTRLYQDKGSGGRASALEQARDVLLQALSERRLAWTAICATSPPGRRASASGSGLAGGELLELGCAAQLHDVGKIAIPEAVLEKPGPLTDSEWKLMRGHTLVGDRIIRAPPCSPESPSWCAARTSAGTERATRAGWPARRSRWLADHRRLRRLRRDDLQRPYQGRDGDGEALKELRAAPARSSTRAWSTALCAEVESQAWPRTRTRCRPASV